MRNELKVSLVASDIWVFRGHGNGITWTQFYFQNEDSIVFELTIFPAGKYRASIESCNTSLVPIKSEVPLFFSFSIPEVTVHQAAKIIIKRVRPAVFHLFLENSERETLGWIQIVRPGGEPGDLPIHCVN